MNNLNKVATSAVSATSVVSNNNTLENSMRTLNEISVINNSLSADKWASVKDSVTGILTNTIVRNMVKENAETHEIEGDTDDFRLAIGISHVMFSALRDLKLGTSSDDCVRESDNFKEMACTKGKTFSVDGTFLDLSEAFVMRAIDLMIAEGFLDNCGSVAGEFGSTGNSVVGSAGDVTLSQKMLDIVENGTGIKPVLASEGVTTRNKAFIASDSVEGKANHSSKFLEESIAHLQKTEFTVDRESLKLAFNVSKELGKLVEGDCTIQVARAKELMDANKFVIDSCIELIQEGNHNMVSEFFADRRGRLYQAACLGPNGQSSDLARAMMDLADVPTDFDKVEVLNILIAEMDDMGSWDSLDAMMTEAREVIAMNNEDLMAFVIEHMVKEGHVQKVWNFIKFAKIAVELEEAIEANDGRVVVVPVAVGLDAKCSGPQLGALMVGDEGMLAATGFSNTLVDDAYMRALDVLKIDGLTRSLVKKAFMAVFYGAGKDAMMDADTITQDTFDLLYKDINFGVEGAADEMANIAEAFHAGIEASFGHRLMAVREVVKGAGMDHEMDVCKLEKAIQYFMADGVKVEMNYRVELDINGSVIPSDVSYAKDYMVITEDQYGNIVRTARELKDNEVAPTVVEVAEFVGSKEVVESAHEVVNFKYTKMEKDLPSFARTGFVNFIQSVDGLLARSIVNSLGRAGAQHIIAIHDCFRVNVTEVALLQEAIKGAYMAMFGNDKLDATEDFVRGTDMLELYLKGIKTATKADYKAEYNAGFKQANTLSQGDAKGTRKYSTVFNTKLSDLINNLGEGKGKTYYFAK